MLYVKNAVLHLSRGTVSHGILNLNDWGSTSYEYDSGTLTIHGRYYDMSKLDRNRIMYFVSFDATQWEVIGRDNDDLSKELNPDVETGKNVIGESTFKHSGYEPEVSVEPYYADPDTPIYNKLKTAAWEERYGDEDIKGYFIEAIFDGTQSSTAQLVGTGKKREAYIVPQSTGGDTSGAQIPYNVYPIGAPTDVNVTYVKATRAVTVTA